MPQIHLTIPISGYTPPRHRQFDSKIHSSTPIFPSQNAYQQACKPNNPITVPHVRSSAPNLQELVLFVYPIRLVYETALFLLCTCFTGS